MYFMKGYFLTLLMWLLYNLIYYIMGKLMQPTISRERVVISAVVSSTVAIITFLLIDGNLAGSYVAGLVVLAILVGKFS